MNKFDVIVIGAGPGGYEAAAMAAADGLATLLIERDALGGTCLNRGCIPTKALCRSAQVATDVASAQGFGIVPDTPGWHVDLTAMVRRKESVLSQLREGVDMLTAGCTKIFGEASLCAPDTVEVAGERYTAPKIIIATGSAPATLPIPGAELCVDSTFMLSLEELPESLAVIGGGVIGMEFASIFSAFGTKVTVIEYCKEILPPFDADIAKRLRTAMKNRGVTFCTSSAVTEVSASDDGTRTVTYESKGKVKTVDARMVLMAVGRKAVTPLCAPGVELKTGRRGIVVDEQYRTNLPGVYAIGDCNGQCMLAHAASAQAAVVMGRKINMEVMPAAVFTHPECAMAGLTQEECEARAIPFRAVKTLFRGNGKALAMNETDGMVKLILSTPDDGSEPRILGCHICGPHAADLITEAALAISAGLPASAIAATIHAHPTLSEVLLAATRQ